MSSEATGALPPGGILHEDAVALPPEVLAWSARIAQLAPAIAGFDDTDIDRRRRAGLELSDALAVEFTAPAPDGVTITDTVVETDSGSVRVRRYRPDVLVGAAPSQVFLHGGGFWSGSVDELMNDRLCSARALAAGIQILSVDYRLAPEHRFPAAARDAITVVDAAVHDRTLGADASHVGIGGNSAGASIAASAAILLRDRGDSPLVHQDLEVLPAALTPVGESATRYAKGYGLDDAEQLVGLYVGDGAVPPTAEPLHVADLTGLPPTLVMAAEFDPLRDSALAYAARLDDAGVRVTVYRGAGHVHGSVGLTATWAAARGWQQFHSDALRTAYALR